MKNIAFPIAAAFAIGTVFGVSVSQDDPFPEFVPRFGVDDRESHVCYILAERREPQGGGYRDALPLGFRGCWSSALIAETRRSWDAAGFGWPYQIVAEYDRELDPLDLDARY